MNSKNHMRLKICGTEYALCSDDSEGYMKEQGEKVEQHIRQMMKDNPSLSISMAAVLTALEYCDDATKSKDTADNLRVQIKEYLSEAARVRGENDELRRRVDELNFQLQNRQQRPGR